MCIRRRALRSSLLWIHFIIVIIVVQVVRYATCARGCWVLRLSPMLIWVMSPTRSLLLIYTLGLAHHHLIWCAISFTIWTHRSSMNATSSRKIVHYWLLRSSTGSDHTVIIFSCCFVFVTHSPDQNVWFWACVITISDSLLLSGLYARVTVSVPGEAMGLVIIRYWVLNLVGSLPFHLNLLLT